MGDTGPLVSTGWLAAHAGDPRVVVADVRWYLSGKRGADEFAAGHLPGAAFVDLDHDLASPAGDGRPGRHPLPTAERMADLLSRLGAGPDHLVVAYDDAGGAVAARLWWLLRYFGHGGGRVLDGGIGAWVEEGRPLEVASRPIAPAPRLRCSPRREMVVDKHAVQALAASSDALLLDARAPERFEGRSEPIDRRPGHIPSAKNAPFAGNLRAPGGRFRDLADLVATYGALGALDAKTVVAYCGSGVTACHDLLALDLAGRPDALLYEGSWSDWAADPALPAATGPVSRSD